MTKGENNVSKDRIPDSYKKDWKAMKEHKKASKRKG